MKDALRDFWLFVETARSVPKWIAAAAGAGPIINSITGMGPPWPSTGGVSLITAIIEICTYISVYQFNTNRIISKRTIEHRLKIALIVLPLSLLGYLFFHGFFTFSDPVMKVTRASGFVDDPELREALEKDVSKRKIEGLDLTNLISKKTSQSKLLEIAGYDPYLLWKGWSIKTVECVLILNWMVFFGSLAAYVGLFVVLQRVEVEKAAKGAGKQRKTKSQTEP